MTQLEPTQKTPEQQTANFLFQQAKVLSNTEIVPSHLKGKPDHIYAIILTGHELGIAPSTALQSFASINGKLTMSAELMRALILGAGHSLSFPESTTETCTIVGKRTNGDTATVTYTKQDAITAGLWGSNAWKKYPRQLLSARATTELARLLFPDVIKGVSYTPEELGENYQDESSKISFEVENATINGELIEEQFDDIKEQEAHQEFQNEDPEYPKGRPLQGKITDAQLTKIQATRTQWKASKPDLAKQLDEYKQLKFGDKSHKELTKQEASDYIEYIEHLKEETNG